MSYKVIGINICETKDGIKLNDGGCALVENGIPKIAISEERLTRKKYAGGFKKSLEYCLENTKNKIENIDAFVFSICCDEPLDKKFLKKILKKNNFVIPESKIVINPSHHIAHACSAFFVSPFKEAIILVVDNEGNILEKKYDKYWQNRLERTSFYYGKENKIKLIGRLHDGFKELGIGAAYNYFTQYLGFKSYQDAGKTMGLAAYGKGLFKNVKVFDNKKKCQLKNKHVLSEQIKSVKKLILEYSGVDIDEKNFSTKTPSPLQKEIAWLIQKETEKIIVKLVDEMTNKTNVTNLCIAGGVALNCVANHKILMSTNVKNIFVQPAAGDTGQCLGNALYGYYLIKKHKRKKYVMKNVFLGKKYNKKEIQKVLKKYSKKISYKESKMPYKETAKLIAEGKIVGWFQGGSEFGPRALGHRSILCNPKIPEMKNILNIRVKHRESFRPFAPSCLLKSAKKYFNIKKPSPFMLFAAPVTLKGKVEIPATVHIDNTARYQTVTKKDNDLFYDLIREFDKITSTPVLLNTSFNKGGAPIIETPDDAVFSFLSMDIDFLVIGNYLVHKKISEPRLRQSRI